MSQIMKTRQSKVGCKAQDEQRRETKPRALFPKLLCTHKSLGDPVKMSTLI